MDTKEHILETARARFNQNGTAEVSTNHIAREAGISPGNLYYHFKNKAHIILAIYEQMMVEWETAYDRIENKGMSIDALKRFTEDNFEMLWKYRFFYREQIALLNADPALTERHVAISSARFQRQRGLLEQAVREGVLRVPEAEISLEEILSMVWIIANHYLIYRESMGLSVTHADFETGAQLVMKLFAPYIPRDSNLPST